MPGCLIRLVLSFCLVLTACNNAAPAVVVVEWATATEINTAGFNLYRSERAEGPFSKINAQLIPASADPMIGGKYTYEDSGVVAGRTYYYQLEDVEFGGATARHGPIVITATAPFGAGDALTGLAVLVGALLLLGIVWMLAWRKVKMRRTKVSGDK